MTLLQAHVAISLIAIVLGFVVIAGLVTNRRLPRWTLLCLLMTALTTATGFVLPLHGLLTPPVIVGIISSLVLAAAIIARYPRRMAGLWRAIYVVTVMIALYLNFFVLIAQMFNKIPALKPFENGPVFLAAQVLALVLFVVLTVVSLKKFHPSV